MSIVLIAPILNLGVQAFDEREILQETKGYLLILQFTIKKNRSIYIESNKNRHAYNEHDKHEGNIPSYIKWRAISNKNYNLGIDVVAVPPSSPLQPFIVTRP